MAIFDVEVEALYFDAREGGVSYAIVDERVMNPPFNARFGSRVSVSATLGEECWEVGLQFLHYHARTKGVDEGEIIPTWGYLTEEVDRAVNLWRVHLGFVDATLSRSWWVSPYLELIPLMGFRFAEVRHKLHVEYGDLEELSFKNKFRGVGPEFGLKGVCHLTGCFGVYARGNYALVYGQFYVHQDIDPLKFFNVFWQTQGMFETGLGIDFRRGQFRATVGWELYLLMGQNQLVRFVEPGVPGKFVSNLGDLSLQGLTIGAGLEF